MLVDEHGDVLGRLPELAVATPWWQDARAVVTAVRAAYGWDVVVLRLLGTERGRPQGGAVIYLAEVGELTASARDVLAPADVVLDDHPLRAPYARPGGPASDLRWADDVLASRGITRTGPAVQDRTWNLSSLWELPVLDGSAWLKVVPPFFAHEGAVLDLLQRAPVPRLLGHDGGRVLLAGVDGVDQYDAPLPVLRQMVSALVRLQRAWAGRVDELLDVGVPDSRGASLTAAVADVVARRGGDLEADERDRLARFVADLPGRFGALAACGLPDTLVHGDFHPGNVRGTEDRLVLLDWGDSTVGHPLLDATAFLGAVAAEHRPAVTAHWADEWARAVPGSRPAQALELLAPVGAARLAVVYQRFVDHIEPTERRYHDADVLDSLRRTARLSGPAS